MKDFDLDRNIRSALDRTFKIGGQKFTRRASVRPEATLEWEGIRFMDPSSSPAEEFLGILDRTIIGLIEPGTNGKDHGRWAKLRAREDDPITTQDMLELIPWLIEEMAGRPTMPPSNSSGEPGPSGTSSTDDSSEPEQQAA